MMNIEELTCLKGRASEAFEGLGEGCSRVF